MKKFFSITFTLMLTSVLLSTFFAIGSPQPISPSAVFNIDWKLTITGLVDQPLTLTLADLIAMPQTTYFVQIICVGPPAFLAEEGNWTGVKLAFLLEKAGVKSNAVKTAFYASDGFTTDLAISPIMNSDVLVAYAKDGNPLNQTLRLAVPGRWGYKWIYNLNQIEVVDYDFLGKYEKMGYSDTALITEPSAPGDSGNLPGRTNLNRTRSSTAPPEAPQNSPTTQSTNPAPNLNPQPSNPPETNFLTEGIIYTAIATVVVLTAGLVLYHARFRKRKPLKETQEEKHNFR